MCFNIKPYNLIDISSHDRRERHEIMKKMQDAHDDIMRVLDAFNNKIEIPINRESLEKFPLLEWVEINELIKVRRRKNLFGDYLNFDTQMKKDGEFGKHFHDDMIESAEVISGKMIDMIDSKVYETHDVMHYEKGEHHQPVALEETLLKVIFKP